MNTEPKVVTLANLSECTAQEVFNHAAYRLKRQKFQRSMNEGSCLYRDFGNGYACAGGHCMTDEEYEKLNLLHKSLGVEERNWHDLVCDGSVPGTHEDLISQLQRAHDGGDTAVHMKDALRQVAVANALDASILDA